MQTIKYKDIEYQVIEVLANQISDLTYIDILGASETSEGFFKFLEFRFSQDLNNFDVEVKSFFHSKSTVKILNNFANPQNFNFTWVKFQNQIEAQIESDIKNGYNYTAPQLMHDCMINTPTYEISLECVYQSLILTNGHEYANYFKEEMLSNIEWLTNMIESSYDDQEDAV